MKTQISTHEGEPVYVDENGKFSITFNGKEHKASTLSLLISQIAQEDKAIEALLFDHWRLSAELVKVHPVKHRNIIRYRNVETKRLLPEFAQLYIYDAAAAGELAELEIQSGKLKNRAAEIKNSLIPLKRH